MRIFFGDQMHYLATRASAQEIRVIMGQMSSVVEAMLDRLKVELATDEFAVALEAFNISAWSSEPNHDQLSSHFRALCKLLKSGRAGVVSCLVSVAKALAKLQESLKARKLQADNRVFWSWTLCSAWRQQHLGKLCMKWRENCSAVVAFYLALKVNTTTLERDLSALVLQLTRHAGPMVADGSTIVSILEVAVEGPKQETSFFKPAPELGGPLGLTPFARLCARLWRVHYGARFRHSYKKDRKKRASSSRPAPGTWNAVIAGRNAATSQISRAALEAGEAGHPLQVASFVPDLTLPLTKPMNLAGTRWDPGSGRVGARMQPKTALTKFKQHTIRKANRLWALMLVFFSVFDLAHGSMDCNC